MYSLKRLAEVESPEEVFPLVMAYSKRTGKNPWLCLYDIMRYTTVVVYNDGIPTCYVSAYLNDNNHLCIHNALSELPFSDSTQAFDDICTMLHKDLGAVTNNVYITSHIEPRLLKRYNMQPIETVYKKTLSTNGGD